MKRSRQPAKKEAPDQIFERPDGFYWRSAESGKEFGPFTTLAEAEADMLTGDEPQQPDDPEALHQAESELGISEWIEPDSGAPADDFIPRIEDH